MAGKTLTRNDARTFAPNADGKILKIVAFIGSHPLYIAFGADGKEYEITKKRALEIMLADGEARGLTGPKGWDDNIIKIGNVTF